MKAAKVSLAGLAVLVGSAFTCDFQIGGAETSASYYLGVPYYPQSCAFCCAAASMQMLQGYCQWGLMAQVQILQAIGGSLGGGAWWPEIADGVNRLTCYEQATVRYHARDLQPDFDLAVTEQIAAVVRGEPHFPVLAQVRFNHVGVLVGGAAHECGFGQYCWDSVAFWDPDLTYGQQYDIPATLWLQKGGNYFASSDVLIQIIPAAVANAGPQLLDEFRSKVRIWDGEGFEPPFEML